MGRPFAGIKKWRAADRHTGIDLFNGIPCTYEHIAGRKLPAAKAEVYRVETVIPFAGDIPLHKNVHYVPGPKIDRFFEGWEEHVETVIDIRPITIAEALAELEAFKARASGG